MRFVLRSHRPRILAGLVAAALPIAMFTGAGAASAGPARRTLANSKPSWLIHAQRKSQTAAGSKVDFGVLLGLRDASGAEATLQAISDPSSSRYGDWLTRDEFTARYAPAAADVRAVRSWLTSQGFTLRQTLGGGLYVEASGSAAQVMKTFSTTLSSYTYQGHTVRANTTALSLPAGAPTAVTGVLGLDQGSALKKPATTTLPGPPSGARYGVQPCSAHFGQKIATDKPAAAGQKRPYTVCGYAPQQLQSAYGESSLLKSGVTGKGVTVAITDAYAAPTILKDAQIYNRVHQQPSFGPGQFQQIWPSSFNVYDPEDAQGWYGEETLDVEAVHAMAPGAKVVFVAGADDLSGLDEAWAQTIDNHVADVVTNSWGSAVDDVADLGQSYIDFYQHFSLEAALTGQTVSFSTGDDGDNTAGGTDPAAKTDQFPADLPYVIGAGGTSVAISKSGQRLGEWGWQTAYSALSADGKSWGAPVYSSGGGGGPSQLFSQPFYQQGKVPARIANFYGKPARAIPDISMPGDPNTGFEVGETQEFPDGTYWDQYRIGGTSLSSPLLAGVLAVSYQKVGKPLGFVNPLLYKLLGTSALYDVVAPKQPVLQVRTDYANFLDSSEGYLFRLQTVDTQSSTLHSTPGYDDETGVGTPNGPAFFTALTASRR